MTAPLPALLSSFSLRPQARGVVDAVSALHDANRGEAITKEVLLIKT